MDTAHPQDAFREKTAQTEGSLSRGEAGVTKTTLDCSRTCLACFPLFYSQLGGRMLYLLLWDIRKCVLWTLRAFPTVLLTYLHVLFPQWGQIWENTGVLANSAALVT